MICPLRKLDYKPTLDTKTADWLECMGEKCAWWDERHGHCCIKTLSQLKKINTHSI